MRLTDTRLLAVYQAFWIKKFNEFKVRSSKLNVLYENHLEYTKTEITTTPIFLDAWKSILINEKAQFTKEKRYNH